VKCIKLAICLLVVLFSVCACSTQESILEEAESTMPETTQTESMETIDSMDVLKEDLVKRLALCITDNNAPDGRTNVNKRFDQYVQTGFLSVRMGPTFETDASDRWFLTKKAKEKLKAAEEHGLTIKLIPQTVSSNPSYLSADADTHMVNQDGVPSNSNCISYWYDGAEEHIEKALRAQLLAIQEIGCLDDVGGIIVDAGAAGEGIYPAGWTQGSDKNAIWCYGENAQIDFAERMQKKYGDIATANETWGTEYESFDAVVVPKPGEAKGKLWEDVLSWYIQVKREFIEKQIVIFQKVINELNCGHIKLIIYMPGTWFTTSEWEYCVAEGTINDGLMLGADNTGMVELAAKYGCCLQYTGVETIEGVHFVRQFMYDNGYENIPVFGENAAHAGLNAQVESIFANIEQTNQIGIDFTDCSFLFDGYGEANDTYKKMELCLENFKKYLETYDYSVVPEIYHNVKQQGD